MIRKMQLTSYRREQKTSQAGNSYEVLMVKLNGKDKEVQLFDKPYLTKNWQIGQMIDLATEERSYLDEYGEKRTSVNYRIAGKIDYLEERIEKLEQILLFPKKPAVSHNIPQTSSQIPQKDIAPPPTEPPPIGETEIDTASFPF